MQSWKQEETTDTCSHVPWCDISQESKSFCYLLYEK